MKLAAGALAGVGLADFIGKSVKSLQRIERINAQTAAAIKSTGGVAQVTSQHIIDMTGALENLTATEAESIQQGANLLLTFTNIRNGAGENADIFDQSVVAMNDMARAMDTTGGANLDMSSTAIRLGKALNDPIKGITALSRVGVAFTQEQKSMITTMVEAGDVAGAQAIILAELQKEFGGSAAAFAQTTAGQVELAKHALGTFGETITGFVLPVLADLASGAADAFNGIAEGFTTGEASADGFVGAMQTVGVVLADVFDGIGAVASVIGDVVGFFAGLPGPVLLGVAALVTFNLLAPLVSLAVTGIGVAWLTMAERVAASTGVVAASRAAMGGLVGFLGGPWTLALTGAALLLVDFWQASAEVESRLNAARSAGEDFRTTLMEQGGELNDAAIAAAELAIETAGLADAFDQAGISSREAALALSGNKDAYDEALAVAQELDAEQTLLGNSAGLLGVSMDIVSGKATENADALEQLAGVLKTTGGQTAIFTADAGAWGVAMRLAALEAEGAAINGIPLLGEAMAVIGQQATLSAEETADAAEKWLESLQSVNAGFVEPLSAYKDLLAEKNEAERAAAEKTAANNDVAGDSWEDYVTDVTVSLAELATRLQEQLDAQDNWRENLNIIAAGAGLDVAQHLAAMGQDGVDLVALMADDIHGEGQRMADLLREDMERGTDGAAAALDLGLQRTAAIAAAGGKLTAQQLAAQLGIGVAEVARLAAQYGIVLAEGINPLLIALGQRPVGRMAINPSGGLQEFWKGGFTGEGGKLEPMGVVHGGEFVFTKEETAKAGVANLQAYADYLRGYADGGFVSTASVPKPRSTAPFGPPISTAGQATMEKAYADVTAWLNTNLAAGGVFEGGTGMVAALNFARSQVGKPYIWGGAGPTGYDCSGFMSAITNVIRGKSPYSRLGATSSMPWSGFAPGSLGAFVIGNSRNTGGGIGHMAGTLLGVNVESAGGIGVRVGGSARGAGDGLFPERYAFKFHNGGIVPNFGMPDVPALLAPGETVRTVQQEAALQAPITVYAQFGTQTIEAMAVRVVTERDRAQTRNARSYQ